MTPVFPWLVIGMSLALPASARRSALQDTPKPPPGISSKLQDLFGSTLKPNKNPAGKIPSTKFTSTGKLIFVDTLIASLKLDATQQEQFRKFIPQVIKISEEAYKANGFENNDLGVSLGGLLEICYELDQKTFQIGSTDKKEEAEDRRKTRAVIYQMQRALGSSPAFAKLADKDKQTAYEVCSFEIGYLAVTWQQAGKDEDKQEAVRQMARQQMSALFRIDPDALTRSAAGELVAKKSDAPPAREGAGDEKAPVEKTEPSEGGQNAAAAREDKSANEGTEPSAEGRDAASGNTDGAPVASPAGWHIERGTQGVFLYTPSDLKQGESFRIAVFPQKPLGNNGIDTWLTAAMQSDATRVGKLAASPTAKAQSDNVASGIGQFTLPDGTGLVGLYFAQSMDKQTVRMTRLLTSPKGELIKHYQSGMQQILSALTEKEKKDAVASGRGLDVQKLPKTPNGITPGGELKPGIYTGTQVYEEKVRSRYRLYLYANGQYRMFDGEGKQVSSDASAEFRYNPRSGLLDLDYGSIQDMSNNHSDPDEDFCLYGRDEAGKPYVYASSNRGFGYATTRLHYAGETDKLSPKEEKETKARLEAEAARYKYVVQPGKGIQMAQIACVVLNYKVNSFYNGSGISTQTIKNEYLLLNDGTIHHGLPVPPDEMDVSLSRRMEPEKWGHWKKQGNRFVAAWPDDPTQYKLLQGVPAVPGSKGLKLSGRYGGGASGGSMSGGWYRLFGVTFKPDGRFLKDNRGGASSSSTYTNATGAPLVSTTYDDEGSFTGVLGSNFTIGTGTKKKSGGDRSGTYSVDGYTMTLRFNNGRVIRQPFFFLDSTQSSIWFEGDVVGKDEK